METELSFNQSVLTLEVSQGNEKAVCTDIAEGKWQVSMDNVAINDRNEIVLTIIANGRLLPNITLKVKTQGIKMNNDPFGGIGL